MNFEQIYLRYHQVIHRYIRQRVKSREDAEDLTQEVFLKAHRQLLSLEEKAGLQRWLYTVARNTVIDHYRSARMPIAQANSEVCDDETEPPINFEERHMAHCLAKMMEKLPPGYREIIKDSALKGVKQKDLSEKYNMEYSSLRSRVQRARARLRELVLDCCKVQFDSRGRVMEVIHCANKC